MLASGLVPKQIGVTASPVPPSPTRDRVGGVFTGPFQQAAAPGRRRPPARVVNLRGAVQDGIGRLIRAGRVRMVRPPLNHAQCSPLERELRREAGYKPPDLGGVEDA